MKDRCVDNVLDGWIEKRQKWSINGPLCYEECYLSLYPKSEKDSGTFSHALLIKTLSKVVQTQRKAQMGEYTQE